MEFDAIINEITQKENQEVTPVTDAVTQEVLNETTEVTENHSEITEQPNELKESVYEFAKARSILHEKIIGKDINGRNVSDWCGCNCACTHSSY